MFSSFSLAKMAKYHYLAKNVGIYENTTILEFKFLKFKFEM